MITDRRTFLAVADLLPDALLLVRRGGEVVAANAAWSTLLRSLGVEPEEDPPPLAVEDPDALASYLARAARSASLLPGSVTVRDGEGVPHRLRSDACVARPKEPEEEGEGPWLLLRLREPAAGDLRFRQLNDELEALKEELQIRHALQVEREQLLEEARDARERAEEASRLKDEFLGAVSHELRTPVNAILGWVTLLKDPDVEAAPLDQGLAAIERNARQQSDMVSDLLSLANITTGRMTLDVRSLDLAEPVREAVERIRPAARAKKLALEAGLGAGRPVTVQGDPVRLRQIAWNLLSNAVKFTPPGGRIQVEVRRGDGDAELVVRDSGEGIDPAFLPYVFDRFRQSDSSMTRRHGGLGLGLAVVRHLVELHGGTVEVESSGPGKGAAFRVHLPAGEVGHGQPTGAGV